MFTNQSKHKENSVKKIELYNSPRKMEYVPSAIATSTKDLYIPDELYRDIRLTTQEDIRSRGVRTATTHSLSEVIRRIGYVGHVAGILTFFAIFGTCPIWMGRSTMFGGIWLLSTYAILFIVLLIADLYDERK